MKQALYILVLLLLPALGMGQIITTFAGTGGSGSSGDGGHATAATISDPNGGIFDKYGNYFFVEDLGNKVRRIDTNNIITTIAGTGVAGYSGDGSAATSAKLNTPRAVALDTFGNIFIADGGNRVIRRVDASTGNINTIAGNGSYGYGGDGGPATAALFRTPQDICFDKLNNLYIADYNDSRVRKVSTSGIVTTIAGDGSFGFSGDGYTATSAKLNGPWGLCVDSFCRLFIADYANSRVRIIDTSGIINTIAGNGVHVFISDSIPATSSQIDPVKICIDQSNNLLIADIYNQRVHRVNASGIIYTIAGTGVAGYSGDGGRADTAKINRPGGVSVDGCGNLFIAEVGNARIRKVTFFSSLTDTPSLFLTASPSDTICAGTTVTYTATHVHGGSYSTYQWFVDTIAVSGATDSFYTYTPANGDSVKCIITTWNRCSSNSYAASNTIHMVVNPLVTPTIIITVSPGDTVCAGTSVTYTASITVGGTAPAYQWKVNGTNVGSGTSTYTYAPSNGDSVRCELTSNAYCASPATVSSNTINMEVAPLMHPTVTLSGSTVVPIGSPVTITATISGAGSSYVLHWFNYSIPFATTTIPSVTYTKVLATDSVTAKLVSDDFCYDSTVSAVHIVTENVGVASPVPSNRGVTCYPNPVGDVLYVESATVMKSVAITNILGQVVFKVESWEVSAVVQLGWLPAGVYILEVVTENGTTYRNKIVKE